MFFINKSTTKIQVNSFLNYLVDEFYMIKKNHDFCGLNFRVIWLYVIGKEYNVINLAVGGPLSRW